MASSASTTPAASSSTSPPDIHALKQTRQASVRQWGTLNPGGFSVILRKAHLEEGHQMFTPDTAPRSYAGWQPMSEILLSIVEAYKQRRSISPSVGLLHLTPVQFMREHVLLHVGFPRRSGKTGGLIDVIAHSGAPGVLIYVPSKEANTQFVKRSKEELGEGAGWLVPTFWCFYGEVTDDQAERIQGCSPMDMLLVDDWSSFSTQEQDRLLEAAYDHARRSSSFVFLAVG